MGILLDLLTGRLTAPSGGTSALSAPTTAPWITPPQAAPSMLPPIPAPRYMRPSPSTYTQAASNPYAGGGGLADLFLGADNQIAKFIDSRQNTISAIGADLASGGKDFSNVVAARGMDLSRNMQRDQFAQQSQSRDAMAKQIASMGPDYRDLANAVMNGSIAPGEGFTTAYQRKSKLDLNQRNAALIKDPNLQSLVAAGGLDLNDALRIQQQQADAGQTDDTKEYSFYSQQEKAAGRTPMSFQQWQQQGGSSANGDDVSAIASAIASGQQPPTMTGLYKYSAPVRAELARQGFDLSKASQDWEATKRLLSSMNGPQQVRLRQAVQFASDSLDSIEQMAEQWNAGQFPALNKAQLVAAKQGLLGPEAASLATRLEAQINDLTSELGTVYKGGNSSTDESLKLAASNLNANWSIDTLRDAIGMVRQNLRYRENSLNLSTSGIPDSQYNQMSPSDTQGSPTALGASSSPARPQSKADYDAIPSGGLFIDPDDGKTYRKP